MELISLQSWIQRGGLAKWSWEAHLLFCVFHQLLPPLSNYPQSLLWVLVTSRSNRLYLPRQSGVLQGRLSLFLDASMGNDIKFEFWLRRANARVSLMHLQGSRYREARNDRFKFQRSGLPDMNSVVIHPNPLQDIPYVWVRRRVPCLGGISAKTQSVEVVFLAVGTGERGQLGFQTLFRPKCRYSLISEGSTPVSW